MERRTLVKTLPALVALAGMALAQAPVTLPAPQKQGGKPLMLALAERKTTRVFSEQKLSPQMLSNLLWAAFGVNRGQADRPGLGRTAPSAMNKQEVSLYVILAEGVYLYEAEPHRLKPVSAGDVRARTGPEAAAQAPVTIIYVADAQAGSAQVDTGFIGQNVYLFAASEGLNAWFRTVNAQGLTDALKLTAEQRPLYAQSVGYPPKQ
jgi:hypothetical protein